MSKPIGFYTEGGKRKPVHAPKSRRGYNQKPKKIVGHQSKYVGKVSREEVREIHASRSSQAKAVDEALQSKTVVSSEEDLNKWASEPARVDVEGIDTKGPKDAVATRPSKETVEKWEKVHDTTVGGEISEAEIDQFGMVLESNHVSGLVMNPEAANKRLSKLFKESEVKERYQYVSLDALKEAEGQHIQIGGSTYDKEMVMRSLEILGQEDVKFRTKGKNSVLIIENKNGEMITLAPCIIDKTMLERPGYIPPSELKKINMGKSTEKIHRKAVRSEHKTRREAMINLVKEMNKTGYNTQSDMPYNWSDSDFDYKYKTPEDQAKFYKNNYGKGSGKGDNFVYEAAQKLYGRKEHWPSDLKMNIVTYEKEPPQWFKETYGRDLDKGNRVVSPSEYDSIIAKDAARAKVRRDRSERRLRIYKARMNGLSEKKQAALDRAKKADHAWWENRGKNPEEAERQKRLYYKNLNKSEEYEREMSELRKEAKEAGYYI